MAGAGPLGPGQGGAAAAGCRRGTGRRPAGQQCSGSGIGRAGTGGLRRGKCRASRNHKESPTTERVPRPGDIGACGRRRGGLRRRLAFGSRMAGVGRFSPQPGQGAVVAGRRTALVGTGTGPAGGARADPAAGAAAPAGFRPQGADKLAPDGAGRHAKGAGQAGILAQGPALAHAWTLAEIRALRAAGGISKFLCKFC